MPNFSQIGQRILALSSKNLRGGGRGGYINPPPVPARVKGTDECKGKGRECKGKGKGMQGTDFDKPLLHAGLPWPCVIATGFEARSEGAHYCMTPVFNKMFHCVMSCYTNYKYHKHNPNIT